jgi:hypothetical protein
MADIAALQQSLSLMETFFENLVGQAGFYMEAMDPNNAQGAGPPPASDAAIASLIQSPLTEKELSLLHNKLCSVCCEAFVVNEKVSCLPCGHFYHPQCVEPWLSLHCTCPSCRYELPTDDDDFEEGRMERMKLRKLPDCNHGEDCCDEDSSNHSSESHPDVTWDETSTASWGEDYDFWYREQLEAASEAELREFNGGLVSYEEPSWMVRLIDEDVEDRPTSTLPAAMDRINSREKRDESRDDGQPTPRASNESKNKTHFDGYEQDDCSGDVDEEERRCSKAIDQYEASSSVEEIAAVIAE